MYSHSIFGPSYQCGLFLYFPPNVVPSSVVQADLQRVKAIATVRDTAASVIIEQIYHNSSAHAAGDAVYIYPLYEGAAVCDFEVEIDGRKVTGQVKEKEDAKKAFDAAVSEGKLASLLESHSADVFQVSIGNIPAGKTVTIRLRYNSEIKGDVEKDQIRLVLPTTIAPRYDPGFGAPHPAAVPTNVEGSILDVQVNCEMTHQIVAVKSPSHPVEVLIGGGEESALDPCKAGAKLLSDSFLDKDFVFLIKARDLDEPFCLAEPHPTDGTHALMLTMSPRFALNDIRSTELIFLIDRSGSMGGSQMQQAKQALELFLRSIPHGSFFNIYSFGSNYSSLFPASSPYTEQYFNTALHHVQGMDANMGGTELGGALQAVLQSRRSACSSTQIFVLTDGEITNVEQVTSMVDLAVKQAASNNSKYLRVFTLGVGNAVSHHLVEGLARAGNGFAQFVLADERMETKVMKMLKASFTPPITNLQVSWTEKASEEEDFEIINQNLATALDSSTKPTISLFNRDLVSPPPQPSLPLPDLKRDIQAAPFEIPPLFPGFRFIMYAILSPSTPVPTNVRIHGQSPDGPVELSIAVTKTLTTSAAQIIHILAARKLIQDLEEGRSYIKPALEKAGYPIPPPEVVKNEVVRLGTTYRIASKYTSWVAVDDQTKVERHEEGVTVRTFAAAPPQGIKYGMMAKSAFAPPPSPARCAAPYPAQGFGFGGFGAAPPPASGGGFSTFGKGSSSPGVGSAFGGGGVPTVVPAGGFGSSAAAPQVHSYAFDAADINPQSQQAQEKTTSLFGKTVGKLFGSARKYEPTSAPSSFAFGAPQPPQRAQMQAAPPPPAPPPQQQSFFSSSPASRDPYDILHAITAHQAFDGSFPPSEALATLLNITSDKLQTGYEAFKPYILKPNSQTDPEEIEQQLRKLYTTSVVIKYFSTHLTALQSEWSFIVEKAKRLIAQIWQNLCPQGGKTLAPWVGVWCDVCQKQPFEGSRHKCRDCADYDLCDECMKRRSEVHRQHDNFDDMIQTQTLELALGNIVDQVVKI